MSTIKDVARLAGVSIGSVSNFINGTRPVSSKMATKIRTAIEELNYIPNANAANLKIDRKLNLGVILPNLNSYYYTQLYRGIEAFFQNTPYFINLLFTHDNPKVEETAVKRLLAKGISGLILMTCRPNDWEYYYSHFIKRDIALVLLDRDIHNLNSSLITTNYAKIIQDITLRLLRSGSRKIALFCGSMDFTAEREVQQAFEAVCADPVHADKAHALNKNTDAMLTPSDPPAFHTVICELNKEDAFARGIQLFTEFVPDTIITTSEAAAIGLREALALLHHKIGSEIRLVSLDAECWHRAPLSGITYVNILPAMAMGKATGRTLCQQILTPKTFENRHNTIDYNSEDTFLFTSLEAKGNNAEPPALPISVTEKALPPARTELNLLMLDAPDSAALQYLLPNYEHTHNIKVNIRYVAHSEIYDAILRAHYGHSEIKADIYMFDIPWLSSLASKRILADLSPRFRSAQNHFLPNCLNYFGMFNNQVYGLPFLYAPQVLYYRKDLFENHALQASYERATNSPLRPPRTWKEFNSLLSFFNNNPETGVRFGTSLPGAYPECAVPELYVRLRGHGAGLFSEDYKVTVNSPQALKAYINYKGSITRSKPDLQSRNDFDCVNDFLNGETAMLITYPSFIANKVSLQDLSLIGNMGYSQVPQQTSILGGWSLGLDAGSSHKDEAFDLLQWITNEENANYLTILGCQPAVASIFKNDELCTLYPWLPTYRSALNFARPLEPVRKHGCSVISQDEIDRIVYNELVKLYNDEVDIGTAIDATRNGLEKLLASYNY
ncbi:MAG: extracellular solute-binding protein [Clostridiaceae bacterium]|nr:extracellular solute-binding protein [Clostridiaceae bacterium]